MSDRYFEQKLNEQQQRMRQDAANMKALVARQQEMMNMQQGMWIQHFLAETARDLYVRMVLMGGVPGENDKETVVRCADRANDLAMQFAIRIGMLQPQKDMNDERPDHSAHG